MAHGVTELYQSCLRLWLIALWHQAINWTNIDSSLRFCSIHHPASIATLAQRQPLCQRGFVSWPNGGAPTLGQHRPNVGTLTLGQRCHNVTPMVVCQRCTNICPTEAAFDGFLWGEPIGHRWIPLTKGQERWRWCLPKQSVEQTVELSNRWFETPMWSTSM